MPTDELVRPDLHQVLPEYHGTHFLVREYHGSTPVATYEFEMWKLRVAGMIRVFGLESEEVRNYLAAQNNADRRPNMWWSNGQPDISKAMADEHGTFHISAVDIAYCEVEAAGLPGLVNMVARYRLLVTFNTYTKRFGVHRYLHEPGFFSPWIIGYKP